MSRAWIVLLAGAAIALGAALELHVATVSAAAPATAKIPTRLMLTVPASVGMGEEIAIEARFTTADGRPVPGAVLTLSQVGAVGQRAMGRATTDEKGAASFFHNEFTLAALSLRVAFAGDAQYGPATADADLEITGIEVPPAVPMSHTPSPLVKAVLFSVLGSVWATYLFAVSYIFRITREGRDTKEGQTARTADRRPLRQKEGVR
jgi:hypothetical protein